MSAGEAQCTCCGITYIRDYPRIFCGSSIACADDSPCLAKCARPRTYSVCECCGADVPLPARGPSRRFCRSSHKSCQTPTCIRLCKARLPNDPALVAAYREARRG